MITISPVVHGLNLREIVVAKSSLYEALTCVKSEKGLLTTRWKLTLRERLSVFFRGDITVQQLTHNQGIQPIRLLARTVNYGDLTVDVCDYVQLGTELRVTR